MMIPADSYEAWRFMWIWHRACLDRPENVSESTQPKSLSLTGGDAVAMLTTKKRTAFIGNGLTALLQPVIEGGVMGPFRGQRNHPATGHRPGCLRNGKTAVHSRCT